MGGRGGGGGCQRMLHVCDTGQLFLPINPRIFPQAFDQALVCERYPSVVSEMKAVSGDPMASLYCYWNCQLSN